MSNDTQTIWFHGQQLITQRADNGDYFVALKPVCEGMGIDFSSQRKRLQQQAWATVVMMTTVGADGKNRNMFGVNRKTLTMWLATIDTGHIKNEAVRGRIITYQMECADALDAYFNEGGAIREMPGDTDEDILARAVIVAQRKIEERNRRLAEMESTVAAQSAQLEEQKPKVLFAESVESSPDSLMLGGFAHDLRQNGVDIGRNRLFKWMREHGYLYKGGELRNEPKQAYVDCGWFEVKTVTFTKRDGTRGVGRTTKLTGRGRIHFTKLLAAAHENGEL